MRNFYTLKRRFFIPVFAALFFQFLVGGYQAKAQGLTGTYTIGASGDYLSFNGAVSALNTNGVSGPVIFNVADGTYSEQIVLGPITGSSATNTITFQSLSGNAANVVLSHTAIGVSDNYVILLENASNLLFKDLTLSASGTTYARTIRGQVELHNIAFEGCVLNSPITNSTSSDRGNVIISASTSSGIRFTNNSIVGGSYGFFYQGTNGSGGSRALGFVFEQNQIRDQFYRGLQLSNLFEAQVTDNRIALLSSSSSSSDGFFIDEVEGAFRFTGNRIEGANQYGL
ncbi:right-handed parallel beta-helix repeat-containing protein, partial [Algoriphagus marinus]|uniref:hypothetical protein n=1 Tax=Algoriphagus marinus TaxID=1925762 RepID=UPI0011152D6F